MHWGSGLHFNFACVVKSLCVFGAQFACNLMKFSLKVNAPEFTEGMTLKTTDNLLKVQD